MSNRMLRVNELILREFSAILRKRYQSESVAITLIEVRASPDLHEAKVFVSVVGDDEAATRALRWLKAHTREIREELGRRIVLKFMPHFEYVIDRNTQRAARVLDLLDSLPPPTPEPPAASAPPSAET